MNAGLQRVHPGPCSAMGQVELLVRGSVPVDRLTLTSLVPGGERLGGGSAYLFESLYAWCWLPSVSDANMHATSLCANVLRRYAREFACMRTKAGRLLVSLEFSSGYYRRTCLNKRKSIYSWSQGFLVVRFRRVWSRPSATRFLTRIY